MKTVEFDYNLPEELIAQTPAARRDASRLLVVDRATHAIAHRRFSDLPDYLRPGDCLIRNTARVMPARLFGRRQPGGGRVECLLLRRAGGPEAREVHRAVASDAPTSRRVTPSDVAATQPDDRADLHGAGALADGGIASAAPAISSTTIPNAGAAHVANPEHAERVPAPEGTTELWWCLLRPGRKLPPGAVFSEEGEFSAVVIKKSETAEYLVSFSLAKPGDTVLLLAERLGIMPLPPYIHRSEAEATDRERYQTVFADREHTVAVAAPTAGLHFTDALLERSRQLGARFADVVLHVGLGTFRPIETDDVADHPIHHEVIEIPVATRRELNGAAAGRRIAVGTTAVRTVEHYARHPRRTEDPDSAFVDEADLFIHPPATFDYVDALITNFHLPRSTLLCLVAAFLSPGSTEGVAWLRSIYAEAIRERYRFLSYGDAMLIL